jgi:putative Holliday junction resolvase
MRVLAVDPGTVRVGLALSDESATLATPLRTLQAGPALATQIAGAAREAGAERIVVGLPRRLDGSEGDEAAAARRLARELGELSGIDVELWDERFTSRMAEAALVASRPARGRRAGARRREATDRVAAAILLQSYLDRNSEAR